MKESSYPPFVDHGGMQSFPPPITFENVDFHGFLLLSEDMKAMETMCTQFFEEPSGGKLIYRPLLPFVILSFCNLQDGHMKGYPEYGSSSEQEVDFWMMAGGMKPGTKDELDHIAAFVPYMFVNNSIALATGREVYGFWKEWGWVTMPDESVLGGDYRLDAFGTKRFNNNVEMKREKIMTLTPTLGHEPGLGESIGELATVAKKIIKIAKEMKLTLDFDLHFLEQIILDAILHRMQMVFLKQFRDIADGHKACYQAITETTLRAENVKGHLVTTPYDFKLFPVDSIPLGKDLGISDQQVLLSFRFNYKMQVDSGVELWKAP